MIDLRWTELSFGISFTFNLLFFLFILLYIRKYAVYPRWKRSRADFGLMFLALCLIIFTTPLNSDDWFNYQKEVWRFIGYGDSTMEPFYEHLIILVNKNYLMFRIIVWGGAFWITCLAFNRFSVNINVSVFFLVAVFLMRFNYARATLAMASCFLGLSFLLRPIKGRLLLSLLLVGLCYYCSYSFHHSILPVLAFTLIAFFPIERLYIIIPIIFLLPVAASQILENGFFLSNFDVEDDILRKFSIYEAQESEGGGNFNGLIRLVLDYGRFFVPIIILFFQMFKYKKEVSIDILRLYRVVLVVLLFAASFLFMDFGSFVFSYRYLFMTFIPITIICCYLYENRFMSRSVYLSIIICGFSANALHYLLGLYHCL